MVLEWNPEEPLVLHIMIQSLLFVLLCWFLLFSEFFQLRFIKFTSVFLMPFFSSFSNKILERTLLINLSLLLLWTYFINELYEFMKHLVNGLNCWSFFSKTTFFFHKLKVFFLNKCWCYQILFFRIFYLYLGVVTLVCNSLLFLYHLFVNCLNQCFLLFFWINPCYRSLMC